MVSTGECRIPARGDGMERRKDFGTHRRQDRLPEVLCGWKRSPVERRGSMGVSSVLCKRHVFSNCIPGRLDGPERRVGLCGDATRAPPQGPGFRGWRASLAAPVLGQRGPLRRAAGAPQMLQLPLTAGQAAANLAQGMRPSQLAKQHRHELTPTGEAPRVPLGFVLLDRLFEIATRKQLQDLRENAAYLHYVESPAVDLVLAEPNPAYQEAKPLTAHLLASR